MTMKETAWVDIGALDDIPLRGARVVKTPAGCIAVFRTAENEAHALEDRCPHKGGPLSPGYRARHVGDMSVAQLGHQSWQQARRKARTRARFRPSR